MWVSAAARSGRGRRTGPAYAGLRFLPAHTSRPCALT
jgi:hypothetical protein